MIFELGCKGVVYIACLIPNKKNVNKIHKLELAQKWAKNNFHMI